MDKWNKHFYEQLINKGNYEPVEQTIVEELTSMLVFMMTDKDEGGQLLWDEERINAYIHVIKDYLIPPHIDIFNKIVEDMKRELLQEEPHAQA